jgi:hypothetical protein
MRPAGVSLSPWPPETRTTETIEARPANSPDPFFRPLFLVKIHIEGLFWLRRQYFDRFFARLLRGDRAGFFRENFRDDPNYCHEYPQEKYEQSDCCDHDRPSFP